MGGRPGAGGGAVKGRGFSPGKRGDGCGIRRLARVEICVCALVLAGCDRPVAPAVRSEPKPVVRMAPVETNPYEDGYTAGFDAALKKATLHAKIPEAADVEPLAREEAGAAPERTERWERGFVAGYVDGFRNVVTGQK